MKNARLALWQRADLLLAMIFRDRNSYCKTTTTTTTLLGLKEIHLHIRTA